MAAKYRVDLWISLLNFKWHSVFTSPVDSFECVIFQCNATKTKQQQTAAASETHDISTQTRGGTRRFMKFSTFSCYNSFVSVRLMCGKTRAENYYLRKNWCPHCNNDGVYCILRSYTQWEGTSPNDWCTSWRMMCVCCARWNFRQATLLIIKFKIHHHNTSTIRKF